MILVIATADFFVVLRLRMGIGVVAAAVVALMQLATTMMLQEGLVVKVEMVVAHVADVVYHFAAEIPTLPSHLRVSARVLHDCARDLLLRR